MKKAYKLSSLSVFFPVFNEEKNLPKLLNKALKIVPTIANKYEILVINDGSTDRSKEIAKKFAKKHSFIKVINKRNEGGYGGPVIRGFKEAKYAWVFFTDSDLQFNLNELKKFVKAAKDPNYDLIIGYRKKRAEGFSRILTARGMKYWNFVFLGFPLFIKDIDCAFKLIKRDVIRDIMPLYSKSNLISSEFLLKAYKKGYRFNQIGVSHYLRTKGKSTCGGFDDIIKVIIDTFRLIKYTPELKRYFLLRTLFFRRKLHSGFSG